MSGHSHAKTIRREKNISDQKRGQMFSKMARLISVAVNEGGPNPESNSKLRLAIETAKNFNMPKDNIERAIRHGSGEISGEKLEEVLFEAYGPGGIAILIKGITGNKNRALGEIKQVLSQNNGKLVGEGAIKWMFERRGCVVINFQSSVFNFQTKEKLELTVIEVGAEDICWRDDTLYVYTKVEELEKVKKNLEEKGIKAESSSLGWVAKEEIKLNEKEEKACQKLFETLDELEICQEIYSNLEV